MRMSAQQFLECRARPCMHTAPQLRHSLSWVVLGYFRWCESTWKNTELKGIPDHLNWSQPHLQRFSKPASHPFSPGSFPSSWDRLFWSPIVFVYRHKCYCPCLLSELCKEATGLRGWFLAFLLKLLKTFCVSVVCLSVLTEARRVYLLGELELQAVVNYLIWVLGTKQDLQKNSKCF